MGLCHYSLCMLWFLTCVLAIDENKPIGPAVNVTKHLSFPRFSTENDPKIVHELKLLGNAELSDKNGAIQIPAESEAATVLRHQAGRVLYSYPIRILDPITQTPASFETTFSFQFINSTGDHAMNITNSSTDSVAGGGGGLTFILVPDEFTVGRPGPWLGMLNDACEENYKAIAIEFDTHQNPEFGDPNDNHVGINLGSIISKTAINASDVGISLKDGSVHEASIVYDGILRRMIIQIGSKSIFSGSMDLSPFLNEYMFVGFSASTGNHTQIHRIFSWNFTSTSQASLRVPSAETCQGNIVHQFGHSISSSAVQSSDSHRHKPNPEPPNTFLIFIAVMALVVAVVVSLFYNARRSSKDKNMALVLPDKAKRPTPPNKPRRFTLSEISYATRCFNELEVLGNNSRGVYYRGKLPNGCEVAIKRFSAQFLSSELGLNKRRVLKKIIAISRVHHPNLAAVRGWCQDKRETMVVYDFYPNGSLDRWLFGAGVLPWARRFKVIKEVADALHFLHSRQLAHMNIKASSVFLDVSFRAILGDFGFVLSPTESKKFEEAVSQKADVFEFGIFVLEVVSGRCRVECEGREEERDLMNCTWRMHEKNEKAKVVDRKMGSVVNMEEAIKVLEIGLLCTLNESKGRPSIGEVVEYLSMEKPIPPLPQTRPVALFPYNSTTGLCTAYSCGPFN